MLRKRSQRTTKSVINAFCAFCREPRKIYSQKSVNFLNCIQAASISALIMWLVWWDFNPRFFVIFGLVLATTEVLLLLRWRVQIVCPHCGFDPVLYLKSPEKVVEKVKMHFERRREDPELCLLPSPEKNLPVRVLKSPSTKDT